VAAASLTRVVVLSNGEVLTTDGTNVFRLPKTGGATPSATLTPDDGVKGIGAVGATVWVAGSGKLHQYAKVAGVWTEKKTVTVSGGTISGMQVLR
jgi:hypothetical protein